MSYLTTFSDVYKEVTRNVGLDPDVTTYTDLAKKWTNAAYQEINNRACWPWVKGRFSFRTEVLEKAGTVTVTQDSRSVAGSGTAFAQKHAGQIFLVQSDAGDKYRILSVTDATNLVLEQAYIDATQSSLSYWLWTKFYTLASDAKQIIGINRVNSYPLQFIFKDDFEKKYRNAHLGTATHWSRWGNDYKTRSYSTGTVSGTAAASVLTGSGTAWLGNVEPGDKVTVGSVVYHIKSVDSDTQITIVERFTSTVGAGTTYTIVSEQAPTIILSGTPEVAEVLEYEYVRRVYPMLADTEVPNIPQQFLDAVVIGGMKYGFEYLGNPRDVQLASQFEAEMKKASLYWDVTYKPDRRYFSAEAYARAV